MNEPYDIVRTRIAEDCFVHTNTVRNHKLERLKEVCRALGMEDDLSLGFK